MIKFDHSEQLKIEKQFKKDFGFTLDEAYRKHESKKEINNEIFHLRCLLNGFDESTNEPVILSDEIKQQINNKLNKLEV